MEVLRTEGVSRQFDGVMALDQITFSVVAGEILAVLGPNGAGKTTLINVINGLLNVNQGELFFCRKRITGQPAHKRALLGISRSFQVDTLFNRMTVLDNVLMSLHGVGKTYSSILKCFTSFRQYESEAQQALENVGLWDKRNDLVKLLSHGEKKKLEIMTAIVSKPRLLLLDEPNAGLTASETTEIVRIIKEMNSDTAVIIVAHDMDMVFSVADQIMVLYYGKLIAKSTPEKIVADPKVKECYLGGENGQTST